jgi:hypothetical protein
MNISILRERNRSLKMHNRVHRLHLPALVFSVVIVYWQVYSFDFLMGWDDQWFITNAYTENGLHWDNIYAILTDFYYGQYAPVNQLYYTVLYSLFQYNPAYFHIASAIVHLVNVLLVYQLIYQLAPRIAILNDILVRQMSFLTALLFSVLPINIEPVAWISASKVMLYAFFYLLALLSYCRYLRTKKPAGFYLTILYFILSFGAKEQAVMLPACLLLLDHVYRRNFRKKEIWIEKLPFILLSILFGFITIQSQELQSSEQEFYPIYERIPLSFYTLSEYFTKSFIPVNLSYLYPFPFQIAEKAPWWLWIYVLAVPAIIYCFFPQIKKRWMYFGALFFLIHIILVLNFIPVGRFSVIADRYAYVASIGLCFIAAYTFVVYTNGSRFKRLFKVAAALYITTLVIYGTSHIGVWENAPSLKERLRRTIENRYDYPQLNSTE